MATAFYETKRLLGFQSHAERLPKEGEKKGEFFYWIPSRILAKRPLSAELCSPHLEFISCSPKPKYLKMTVFGDKAFKR